MGVTPETRPVVLVVTHNYIRDAEDQAGQFIHTLITPMLDRYRMIVVAPHHAGLPTRETIDGVEIVRFRYAADFDETLAYEGNMHEQVFKSWAKRFLFLRFMRAMRRETLEAVKRERPIAVHIHWWVPGAMAVGAALSRKRVPYILTTHGSDVTLLDKFTWLRPVARSLFKRASAATAVSEYLKSRLQAISGVCAVVLPMPYDDQKFKPLPMPPATTPRVTCIGRFVERKGHTFLLQAAAHLKAKGISIELEFVGDGPLRKALEKEAQSLGLQNAMRWTGNIPHAEIPGIIQDCHIVVLPSVRDWKGEVEGLGMVLVEASACGRPVIGTDLAGIKDAVVHGKSGLLVPPANATALADAIATLVNDSTLAAALGKFGTTFAPDGFSPARQAGKLADIIESVRR
jgi:glycosyltransferase involved in cell wall biosynthesis